MKTFFNLKYFKILQTFSEEELKAFELWLRSPWCNSNKNLIKLLEKIKKYHPVFDDKKLTKEKLFKQILPKGKFSDRRMNNLLSEGYLAAERFIIFQNLTKDENLKKDLLTKEFQNRHLEDWFFRDVNKEIARLEDKEIKDWEDHLDLLQLNRRMYHHPNQNLKIKDGGKTIRKIGEQLDLIYLLEKAAIINEKIFRNRLLKNENHKIKEELKFWKIACEKIIHPSIELYKIRFNYSEKNMLREYYNLRKIFVKRFEELNSKEQNTHLFSLLNDTALLSRKKYLDLSERLPLYKLGLKSGILFTQNKLTYITYYSIVTASNTQKEFDFTIEFINNYTTHLDTTHRQDAKIWALAHTSYRKQEFQNALDFLLQQEFQLQFFKLATRLLTTQIYFDLYLRDDSYQLYLFNYFDSFEKWITREKDYSKSYQMSYIRFVQVCRKLAKAYGDVKFDEEKINNIFQYQQSIQAPKWLNKKINEIVEIKKRGRSFSNDL